MAASLGITPHCIASHWVGRTRPVPVPADRELDPGLLAEEVSSSTVAAGGGQEPPPPSPSPSLRPVTLRAPGSGPSRRALGTRAHRKARRRDAPRVNPEKFVGPCGRGARLYGRFRNFARGLLPLDMFETSGQPQPATASHCWPGHPGIASTVCRRGCAPMN